MKKWIFILIIIFSFSSFAGAQDDTTTDNASTDFSSTVNWFFVACEDRAVLDLNGTMGGGDDLYVQVFRDLGGTGTPLTQLRRIAVNGAYEVSPELVFTSGEVLAFGQFASARISIGRESDSSNTSFTTTVDDVQDGCSTPAYSSVPTTGAGTGVVIDPVTGEVLSAEPGAVISSSGIYKPGGGFLNEVRAGAIQQEGIVQIGARPSQSPVAGRTSDAGLIFAECDDFSGAAPGRLFDTDNLTIYWSWFARTAALAREHQDKAIYEIWVNNEFVGPTRLGERVTVTPVVRREDGNYWIFYLTNLGDRFKPGRYNISYRVTWSEVISDGYEDFGPGTENEALESSCTFTIEENPWGIDVIPRNPDNPLQPPER